LGHKGFHELQKWAAEGSNDMPPDIAHCKIPVSRACQYGAAKKRKHEKSNTGSVSGTPEKPGDFVSVDQMVAGSPDLIPFTSGQPSKRRYNTVTMWVDHFSRFLYAHCQEDATTKSTLESKIGFESFARRYNVSVKHIHGDNGVFASKTFQDHVAASDQHQSFCGVGAHWQNGVIERFIGVITTRARTMLLHAMDQWPDDVTAEFWSFAFMNAVHLQNCTPRPGQSQSPFTLFTDEDSPLSPHDFRIFGSPVYVLDKALQDGTIGPGKWKDRCYQGVYIGHSPNHASNVIQVFNPNTRLVSPQYHVVHDESFDTVNINMSEAAAEAKLDAMLDTLFETSQWRHSDMYSDSEFPAASHHYFDSSWDVSYERAYANSQREHEQRQNNGQSRKRALDSLSLPGIAISEGATSLVKAPSIGALPLRKNGHSDSLVNAAPAPDPEGAVFSDDFTVTEDSNCISKPDPLDCPKRLFDDSAELATQRPDLEAASLCVPARPPIGDYSASPATEDTIPIVSQLGFLDSPKKKRIRITGEFSDATSDSFTSIMLSHLQSLVSQFESFGNTVPYTHMFRASDQDQFLLSQIPEIKGLCDAGVFEFQNMSQLPSNARLLNAIWSYRRKRRPDGVLLKHKSRICADGSQQKYGVDYWETYAPVVHWSTVRMVLVLSTLLKLKSRQIDYTQAFPQAPVDDDVFMRIPQGWSYDSVTKQLVQCLDDPRSFDREHFIRLKRNLYGVKQAARNWYIHLKNGLLGRGFVQSKIDPCLFIRKDCLIVLYTDDCLVFANSDDTITDLCKCLSTEFLLKDEGNIENFLGINITHKLEDDDSVTITMTQKGLIDQILEDVGLVGDKVTQKKTPAKEVLQPNPNAAPFDAEWSYRSVIGKLNFLAQNTRPDISMTVHMCARFVNNPNRINQDAVKYLCRYLHYTQTRGLILKPTGDNRLNAHVDSDFAGQCSRETCQLRDFAVSQTGYVIMYCGCPIHWVSKLQSEIALSTTEAEYQALSMCLRDLLPMRTMLSELSKGFNFAGGPDLPILHQQSRVETRMLGCTSRLFMKITLWLP
jgi:transposase InsO family protein